MSIRNVIILLMPALLCGCATDKTVEQHITSHARQLEAHEYQPARMVAEGDIDGDGIVDAAVIYTLEGTHHGNNYKQFLAVRCSHENDRFFYVVAGGKDVRSVDSVRIVDGRVELALLEYNESDASCCPSRQAGTSYVFKNKALVETRVR